MYVSYDKRDIPLTKYLLFFGRFIVRDTVLPAMNDVYSTSPNVYTIQLYG